MLIVSFFQYSVKKLIRWMFGMPWKHYLRVRAVASQYKLQVKVFRLRMTSDQSVRSFAEEISQIGKKLTIIDYKIETDYNKIDL